MRTHAHIVETPHLLGRAFAHRHHRYSRWLPAVIILLVLALAAGRIYLPIWLTGYVNRTLDRLEGYRGKVESISVHLYRGAYVIHGVKIVRTNGKVPVPFFASPRVDLSVEWRALFDGSLVGEIFVDQPHLNFVSGPTAEQSQTTPGPSWQHVVADLFPLKINSFKIRNGQIHYQDFYSDPKIDVSLDSVNADAVNLTNSKKVAKTLVAKLHATALAEHQAPLEVNLAMDPYHKYPTFSMDASLKDLDLNRLNDLFRAYADFDVEKGRFDLYAEAAAENGDIHGYVKPLLRDVHVLRLKSDLHNPLRLAWESLVAAVVEIVTNQRHDQVASRIPISGKFSSPEIGLWRAIGTVLSNAFIQALMPGLEESVSLKDVERK